MEIVFFAHAPRASTKVSAFAVWRIVFSYFFHTLPELISSVTNIFAEITGAAGSSDKNVYTVQNFWKSWEK